MKLYCPGIIPWRHTQALYHALAEAGQEALVLCRPAERYVCLGFHDDLQQEVNLAYCKQHAIPLIRRETGGGMVLLDQEQVFFQLILRNSNPLLNGRRDRFFQQFLTPALAVLADFGLQAVFGPPADILVGGRKISGNGAGDINGYAVYIGNLLLGFDRRTMAGVFQSPDRRFSEYTEQSLEQNLTTMAEELGCLPSPELVEKRLLHHFQKWLPALTDAGDYRSLGSRLEQAAARLGSPEMMALPGKKRRQRQVKIREGVYVRWHPWPGGTHQGAAMLVLRDGRIAQVSIVGQDILPPAAIPSFTAALTGIAWSGDSARAAIAEWRQSPAAGLAAAADEQLAAWIVEGVSGEVG